MPARKSEPASLERLSGHRPGEEGGLATELRAIVARIESTEQTVKEHASALAATANTVNSHAERMEMFRLGQVYIDKTMTEGHNKLTERLEELSNNIRYEEQQARHDNLVTSVRDEVAQAVSDLHARALVQFNEVASALAEQEKRVECALQKASATLKESFARDLAQLEARSSEAFECCVSTKAALLKTELTSHIEATKTDLHGVLDSMREEMMEEQRAVERRAKVELHRAKTEVDSKAEALSSQSQRFEERLAVQSADMGRLERTQCAARDDMQRVRSELEASQRAAGEATDEWMVRMESNLCELRNVCASTDAVLSRSAEWELQAALKRFQALQRGDPSERLLSPMFDAGGICGLQLELRSFAGDSASEQGDCSLLLWVPARVRLTFKLYLGSAVGIITNEFNGESPCGISGFCNFSEQVDLQSGCVFAGVEIHEASAQTLHIASAPLEMSTTTEDGSVICRRYLNNKLQELMYDHIRSMSDQVAKHMNLIRSKAVRRVQWRLEHAFKLREIFTQGRPVCSAAFQAAGIAGLHLVFFPSGCDGAKDGFCSLFLSCPDACALKCWLWAGRWRKEVHAQSKDGVFALGRANFCRFESCVDPADESVEVAVEIEETQHACQATESTLVSWAPTPSGTPLVAASPTPGRQRKSGTISDGLPSVHHDSQATTSTSLNLGKVQEAAVQQLPTVRFGEQSAAAPITDGHAPGRRKQASRGNSRGNAPVSRSAR